ncbi:unnamed protein product, partial [Ixodes pacificus]
MQVCSTHRPKIIVNRDTCSFKMATFIGNRALRLLAQTDNSFPRLRCSQSRRNQMSLEASEKGRKAASLYNLTKKKCTQLFSIGVHVRLVTRKACNAPWHHLKSDESIACACTQMLLKKKN